MSAPAAVSPGGNENGNGKVAKDGEDDPDDPDDLDELDKGAGKGGFLVTEADGTKHLPTTSSGKPDHGLMGGAWAALHDGYRGNKYQGPGKQQAIKDLKALYEREGMRTPDQSKAAIASQLRKGLFDVAQLAMLVDQLDWLAKSAAFENENEKDTSEVPAKLKALRDELGAILVQMASEEVGELGEIKMGDMTAEQIAKSILDKVAEARTVEKKGAKMSGENRSHFQNCQKAMETAAGYFGKAAETHADDSNLSTGMTHFSAGLYHMSKIDIGAAGAGEGEPVGGKEGALAPTAADAANPSKVAPSAGAVPSADDIRKELEKQVGGLKADFEKQIEAIKAEAAAKDAEIKELTKKAHDLEIENARMEERAKVNGARPTQPRAFLSTINRGDGTTRLAAAAGAGGNTPTAEDLKIDPNDNSVTPQGVGTNFRKALTVARQHPRIAQNVPAAGAGA